MTELVEDEMRVLKRNGKYENIGFDKILKRVKSIGQECGIKLNYTTFVMKVIDQLYDGIPTAKIDELTAEQCASLSIQHPDYNILAGRLIVSNHHKNTNSSFFSVMKKLYQFKDVHHKTYPLVNKEFFETVEKNKDELDKMIDHERDYLIDYFGFKTLERAYLMKIGGIVVERPQYLWLRVAIAIHGNNMEKVRTTYDLMSQKYFTHATPTLFNAGTPNQQLSSCYLLALEDDSITGIYNTLSDCAQISKYSGGIGLHIHNIRAAGSHIRGTNGKTDGLVPMLKVYNATARYVNQCFTPDSWVYSKNGPKQFQEVTIEDELVTVDGTFKKVNEVIVTNVHKEILEIRVTNSIFPIKVTKEHELYLIKNQKKLTSFSVIKNRLEKNIIEPKYYSADELSENDLVGFPIPTFEQDNDRNDLDFYQFYGMMLGDGHICKNDTESGITMGTERKQELIQFVKGYLTKLNIHYWENEQCGSLAIKWSNGNNDKIGLSRDMLYNATDEKCIHTSFIHLPKHKILKMIEGLLKTDGSNLKELYFCNTSLHLIMQLRYLLLRLGILTSGNVKNNIGESHTTKYGRTITTRRLAYNLRIPKHPNLSSIIEYKRDGQYFKYFEWNNTLWGRVKNICKSVYSGDVYDFNMIDNHNYLTDMGLVHNSGKRAGSFAIYLEPWHADIDNFLDMKKNHGDEEMKARDLFYALWIPDLFMERVKTNGDWTLMCPDQCPGLSDVYGAKFAELYTKYETDGKGRKTVKARDLWFKILDSQMETGTPYLLYKDAVNEKSNQKNLGTIKSSNLCTEINEYSDDKETAVCNLASIGLSMFVKEDKSFDYDKLHEVTKVVAENLDKVIDINFYPTDKTKRSNMRHRPVGIGVQGLADVFALMDIPFHSEAAKTVNILIFETIYHAALEKSMEIAKDRHIRIQQAKADGKYVETGVLSILNNYELHLEQKEFSGSYSTFEGSPLSQGIFQFDMWSVKPSDRYDWPELRKNIIQYGVRNSLSVAPMPTASTAQILGNNECFEPFTSNIYTRRTLAGEFIIVNKYLMKELIDLKLWNEDLKNNIIANNGSVQHIDGIPKHIKDKYKIVWEIPMKHIIDMSRDRGAFICQSQSLNLWVEEPTYKTLTSMHFYSWEAGLKTGIYYLRRKAKHQAQQFTIEPEKKTMVSEEHEVCEMCSS